MKDYFNLSSPTRFLFPIDGDFINERDGRGVDGEIEFEASVFAAAGSQIAVNGAGATEEDGKFSAMLRIKKGENRLVATNCTDGTSDEISVFYLPGSVGKYRISSDDNILFLADITKNADRYESIFENPYLAVYKKAHDLYGAKVHLNLFYAFDRTAAALFSDERPDFDLSMMTDKFKAEWEENSDWLKLSFHSRTEFPDAPYRHARPETVVADYLDVRREVLRFAGEKSFSEAVTTVHFGAANREGVAALRDLGHKALTGYFEVAESGRPLVAYYADVPLALHVGERDFWRDTEMGMTFGRIDRVTNIGTLSEVMADMEKIIKHPTRGGFVSIMIHEQYFHADYENYLPDFEERVLGPSRLLWERGYTGSLLSELLCE